jgi:SWI/SNF-related matrix-associated actin-dependent regulator 1 of chromatin subfamily A
MTELRPFQLEGVEQIYKFRGRALLADEQGLGKTIQALYWLLMTPKRRPALIVVPAPLKYSWHAEAMSHFGMRTTIIEGRMKKSQRTLPGEILIINYEIFVSWLPLLLKYQPETVIFDECHYIKNPDAQRTQAAWAVSENACSVVGLSGTPLTKRPIELWSSIQAIRPDLWPSRTKYGWRYCKPRYTPWGFKYDGATRKDELHEILFEEVMIRRKKKEVAKELPDKIRTVVRFKLDSYTEYNKAKLNFLKWLKAISPSRAAKAKKSECLTKVGYLARLVSELKLDWTAKWIQDWLDDNEGEKLICFTMHSSVIQNLQKRFAKRCVVLDGSVTGIKREHAKRRFINNQSTDLLLGNWKAAGVGHNLQVCSNIVALDLPWTPGDMWQGEDRIHRIGQTEICLIYYLLAMDTVEEKQWDMLQADAGTVSEILDGEKGRETDALEGLLKGLLE